MLGRILGFFLSLVLWFAIMGYMWLVFMIGDCSTPGLVCDQNRAHGLAILAVVALVTLAGLIWLFWVCRAPTSGRK
jgi:hypothetical protein